MKKIFTLSVLLMTLFGLNMSAESISCAYSFWTSPTTQIKGTTTITYDSDTQVYTVALPQDSTNLDFKFKYDSTSGLSYYDYNGELFTASSEKYYTWTNLGQNIGYVGIYGGTYCTFLGDSTAGSLALDYYVSYNNDFLTVWGTDMTLQWPAPEAQATYPGTYTDGATSQRRVSASMEEYADSSRVIRNFLGVEGYDLKFDKEGKVYSPYYGSYIMDQTYVWNSYTYYYGLTTSQQATYSGTGTAIYPVSATVDENRHSYTLKYKTADMSYACLSNLSDSTYTYTYQWSTETKTTCEYSFWTAPTTQVKGTTTLTYNYGTKEYTVSLPQGDSNLDFKFKYDNGLKYYDYNGDLFTPSRSAYYTWANLGQNIGYVGIYGGSYCSFVGDETSGMLALDYYVANGEDYMVVWGTDVSLQWPAPTATTSYPGKFTDGSTAQTGVAATMDMYADSTRIIRNFLGAEGFDIKINKEGAIYNPYYDSYNMNYELDYWGTTYRLGVTTSQQPGSSSYGKGIYPISAAWDETNHTYTLKYKTADLSWAWLYNLSDTEYTYTFAWDTESTTTCEYSFWTTPTNRVRGTTKMTYNYDLGEYTVNLPQGDTNLDFKFKYQNGLKFYDYNGDLFTPSRTQSYAWANLGQNIGYVGIYGGSYCTYSGDANEGLLGLDYYTSYNDDYMVIWGTDLSLQWPAKEPVATYNGAFTDGSTAQTGVLATMEEYADNTRIIRNFLGSEGYDIILDKDGNFYTPYYDMYTMNYELDYWGTTYRLGIPISQQPNSTSGYGKGIFPTSATLDTANKTYTLKYKTGDLSWAWLYNLSDTEYTYTYVWGAAGVDNVSVDNSNAPVEYYNLNGVKVVGDNLTPGIYIKRQGSQASKVYVK